MPAPPPQSADRAASRLPQAPRSSWPADRGRTQGPADLARLVARLEAFAADSDPAKQAASATLLAKLRPQLEASPGSGA